jgi:putative transposase
MKMVVDTEDPDTGRTYSTRMVLRVLGVSPSAYYSKVKQREAQVTVGKRGPLTSISDNEIYELLKPQIKEDPFFGTGYKKLHARLNRKLQEKGHSIGKNRLFRIMQEHDLLGKAPGGSGSSRIHDGKITTEKPDEMWGTDGKKFWTKKDGWCWLFDTVDHFNSEIIGWNVVKTGDRFEATRSVQNAVCKRYGSLTKGIASGLKIRSDLGTQYTSDYFKSAMNHLGVEISYSWAHSPECNGIIERFHRTIQEQVFDLHNFETIDEAINTIEQFINKYNEYWILERLGYQSPGEAMIGYKLSQDKNVA